MDNMEKVKCSKCGFMNLKGTRTCSKCHTNIESYKKSCPKCGKVNSNNVKRCVNCNFDFMKKRSNFGSFIISLGLVIILMVLVYFDKESIVEKFSFALKVLAGFMVFLLIVNTITYGSKEKINYSAEDEMIDKHKKLNNMKKRSKAAIFVGIIISAIILVIYYFTR